MQEYHKKGLIIAISDYMHMKPLDFCKNDGSEMREILTSKPVGFDIPNSRKLIGQVSKETLENAIYDFFDPDNSTTDDILLFYYSGHGAPGAGNIYIASSEIDPDKPNRKGFSFSELTNEINNCNSMRMVTILDCCYSGTINLAKGDDDAAVKIAKERIDEGSRNIEQGQGKYMLAASQGYQEAYSLQEKDHSIFTYYLLEGLKGNENSLDNYGNVTPESLTKYISREIRHLPDQKRLNQTPIMKSEASGDVILASYPELRAELSHKVDLLKPHLNLILKRLDQREKYFQRAAEMAKKEIAYDPSKSAIAYIPVSDLYLGILSCNAVCLVHLQNGAAGTGFMISPSLMLTMNHVIPNIATARTASLDFNFEDDIDRGEGNIKTYSLEPEYFFYAIPTLNSRDGVTIVAVNPVAKDDTPLYPFGYLPLAENVISVPNETLSLIHQPGGGGKYLSFKNLVAVKVSEDYGLLEYQPKTPGDVISIPGSAGGPVLNSRWQLVGVHSFNDKTRGIRGGALTSSVYKHLLSVSKELPEKQKEVLNELFER
jgi:V8-like Glu-specific endopeptidase